MQPVPEPASGGFDDFGDRGQPVLITAAAPSFEEQHRQRVRKYLTLMAFRIPALVLAAVAYGAWHNGLISLAILAASLPLPWIAVLIANDRPPRRADEPRRYDPPRQPIPLSRPAERPALERRGLAPGRATAQPNFADPDDARRGAPPTATGS